jgi:hypothetical protein
MFQNAATDVAIGLILMYLMLSLLCTVVNEFVASCLKMRSRHLAAGLKGLLDDPALRNAFYGQGLIAGTKMALAGDHPSYLSAETFAQSLTGALTGAQLAQGQPTPGFPEVKAAIEALPPSNIKSALQASLMTAQGDFNRFRDSVTTWFDDSMDRLSGSYTRHLKVISMLVGCAVAVILNADTFAAGHALWFDSGLRAQVAQVAATAAVKEGRQPSTDVVTDAYRETVETLSPLPVGWPIRDWPGRSRPVSWVWGSWIWFGIAKFGGWLATGLALSLGAPFWFDLLSKFVNLRGAGVKPSRQDAKPNS